MEKQNVKTKVDECRECWSCQLICSLTYLGVFDPLKARILIEPGIISFTDDCVEGCHLCANNCPYGALTVIKT